jgi:hypothetical protein
MMRNYAEIFEDETSRDLCQDADEAITKCKLWDWLKEFQVKDNEGFEFTNHENIFKISNEMKYKNHHSGFSFAWTLRQMQFVAQNGFEALKERVETRRKEKLLKLSPETL